MSDEREKRTVGVGCIVHVTNKPSNKKKGDGLSKSVGSGSFIQNVGKVGAKLHLGCIWFAFWFAYVLSYLGASTPQV